SKLSVQPVFQVVWALTACLRIDKVRDSRYRPWLLNQSLGLAEELLCQRGKRVGLHGIRTQQATENIRFLNGDGNSLAIHRVQAADCVSGGQQSRWKTIKPPEVPPLALRKSIAFYLA